MSPPTGGKLHFDAPDLDRITDGKIAKDWADDGLAILAELGVYTPGRADVGGALGRCGLVGAGH